MSLVSIYQIQAGLFKKTFGRIITKIYDSSQSIQIVCSQDELKEIDDLLWTFDQLSFLPHSIYEKNEKYNGIKTVILDSKMHTGFESVVFMSYHLVTQVAEKNFIIDRSFEAKDTILNCLPEVKCPINIFTQSLEGSWEKDSN